MGAPLIQVEDLHCAYPSERGAPIVALDGVSLTVHEGEFVAVLGANGSGKSTLARHLNGLLVPTHGEVRVAGRSTRDPSYLPDVRRTVAMVFQNPDSQIVATTVEEDVAFGPENLGLPRSEVRRRVDAALAATGLAALRDRPPHQLSGGQKQRLAVAGALALQPRCLVLDEATAMLDPTGRQSVLDVVETLRRQGTGVVLITQLMHEATRADRVVVLHRGRVLAEGAPRQVFCQVARLVEAGLEPPPLAQIAQALARRHPGFPHGILTVEELLGAVRDRVGPPRSVPYDQRDGAAPRPPDATARPTGGATAVLVEDLWHTYLPNTPLAAVALRGARFYLPEGRIVGLLGSTGSGKSTLMQHFNGLLRPQRGRVLVLGIDLSDPRTDVRGVRARVGLVFQYPEHQLFAPTVGDDIAFGPRRLGFDRDEVRRRVQAAMELVGLDFERYKDRSPFALSAGERRRVALAGVLALEPKVLALDEPFAGLDPAGRRHLIAQLRRLRDDRGSSVALVSHGLDDLLDLADEAFLMREGRTVSSGAADAVVSNAALLREVGLDPPPVVVAMDTLRAVGYPVPPRVATVDAAIAALDALLATGGSQGMMGRAPHHQVGPDSTTAPTPLRGETAP